jgi:peptidyl-prolyl cis-trans isomerase C
MLRKPKRLLLGLLSIAIATSSAISFAKDEPAKKAEAEENKVIATVNGVDITMEDLGIFLNYQRSASPGKQQDPNNIMSEVISREIIKQDAIKQGIDKRPDFIKDLEFQRSNLLVNTLLAEKIDKADLSEEALKKEYDAQIKGVELMEYKARHILLKTEDEAKTVIKQIKEGGDFVELAKEKSTGPTGPKGGDLGWFQPASMVPEFAVAMKSMKKGESSSSAVKTQFGWHIIKLEDTRKKEAPSFEKSKEQIKTILANNAVQEYLKGLRKSAKVDIKQMENAAPEAKAPQEAAPPH